MTTRECHYTHCDWHDGNRPVCHRTMCLASKKELELFAIIHHQELTISGLQDKLEKHDENIYRQGVSPP
jgi:hypothetical protein